MDAVGIANSVDPDKTVQRNSLIKVCFVKAFYILQHIHIHDET